MGYIELTQQDITLQKKLLQQYQIALKKLPQGRLTYKIIKGKPYYYWIDAANKQHYISSKDIQLICDLKYRRFLEESIRRIERNLPMQEKLLKSYTPYDPHSIQQRLPNVYSDLHLPANILTNSAARPIPNPDYRPESLTFSTSFGIHMRSKSEVIIAELIHAAKIPFQYEPKLRLKTPDYRWITYHPDFAIVPPLGDEIYWEHAGLLSNENYRNSFFRKIAIYHHNNIVMPKNLIVTMDNPDGTLDVAAIDRIIKGQLLPLFAES